MSHPIPGPRVVEFPVEPHSETTVPIWYVLGDNDLVLPDAPVALWAVGLGERGQSAIGAAGALPEEMFTGGMYFSYAQVAKMASNVRNALGYWAENAMHVVANEVAPDRRRYLCGNSLGGLIATHASNAGPCEALAVLSGAGTTNRQLGPEGVRRLLAVAARIGKAGRQQDSRHPSVKETVGDVIDDGRTMRLRVGLEAARFVLDDAMEDKTCGILATRHRNGLPTVYASSRGDGCARYDENLETFSRFGCQDILMELTCGGPHGNMGTPNGQQQIQEVSEWLRAVYSGEPMPVTA